MDVVSSCPLRVSSLLWQPRAGAFTLTVVCKATYDLVPHESPLAREQEDPNEADGYWNDDESRSLHAASDLAPFKRGADLLLIGHAFAPHGNPVSSLVATMVVGEIEKSVAVTGDRTLGLDGQISEAARFTKMPLRWERAAGGPDTWNPVGLRLDARADARGRVPVPNLTEVGAPLPSGSDVLRPAGFGPIAPAWPGRVAKLRRHAATWDHRRWNVRPLPEDVEAGYFNAAPADQQGITLRPNERIVLENLLPQHPRFVTNLVPVVPRAVVEGPGAQGREISLVCDTLVIDTDRGHCTVTWRGQIPLPRPDQPGRVVFSLRGSEPQVAVPSEGGWPAEREGDPVQTLMVSPAMAVAAALPFAVAPSPPPPVRPPSRIDPVAPAVEASPWLASSPSPPAPTVGQMTLDAVVRAPALVPMVPGAEPRRAALMGRPVVDLLWFNPGSLSRIRKHAAWKEILAGVKPRAEDEDLDDDLPAPRRTLPKDRRDVLAVLSRGEALDVDGVEAALTRAMEDEEGFIPPLVLVEGELTLHFDELETLKATLAAVSPHLGGDPRLKEVVDQVSEVFKMPWVQGSNGVIEELTGKVREAFAQGPGRRAGAVGQMEAHVERALVEQRHFRKAMVLGQSRVRGALSSPGAAEVMVYLPESVGKELPAFRRFAARVVGEVRGAVEAYAGSGAVIRAVAVGRVGHGR